MVANRIDDPEKLSLVCQLVDLATSLRQERLFVISEQTHLQQLNNNVNQVWFDLTKLVWVTWQQRICVNKLSISQCDFSPSTCCGSITSLDKAEFEAAHKILSYQANLHFTQLLNFLKSRPQLLAQCLSVVNQTQSEFLTAVIESIILGLYGCCLLPEDKAAVLELLLHLTHLQLLPAEDPLRLIRHGSCAFARLYSLYHEGLYSATLFLTAALYSPIRNLLMEDEKFLDIDPDKALIRFAAAERLKMFGAEGSPEYKANLQKYRLWNVNKLVAITNKFIESIRANIHCFPNSICWLVRHIYRLLVNARKLQEKQIFALCVDLVVTSFICPAIVNPESYGIIDAPVSYIARFNLIQVAKILQMLAMRKYEPVDPKVADLYKHFDEDCLSSIINVLLEDALQKNQLDKEPSILDNNDQLKQMARNASAFFTEQQLHNLIIFLQAAFTNEILPKADKTRLEELISLVAADISPVPAAPNNEAAQFQPRNLLSPSNSNGSISPVTIAKRQIQAISRAVSKTKQSAAAAASSVLVGGNEDEKKNSDAESNMNFYVCGANNRDLETVLVFTLEDDNEIGMLGLLTEEQVLQGDACNIMENAVCDTLINVDSCVEPPSSQGKTISTCCSSQDGEVGSEEGSNESENSSMDLGAEDQNDNLSDMISANVSGRGTPNISGRDTPSSQIMENENEEPSANEPAVPPAAATTGKQPRFDLDDKFGKFEIKSLPRAGDETVSLVSDTWSTDVLGSDSDNLEQNQSANSARINAVFSASGALAMFENDNFPQLIDISETESEGWSTDVVVSDSDRVTEVDTDDTASVARSDTTTRSEVESRGEGVDPSAEDIPPASANASSSLVQNPRKEAANLIHLIDLTEDTPTTSALTPNIGDTRPNLLSSLSQSSTTSQSRSNSSHQASVDSEDMRVTSGDAANRSISSAASVSSSSSSAGLGDGENPLNFNEQVAISSRHVISSTYASSSSVTSSSMVVTHSSTTISNGCAIMPSGERENRPLTSGKSISFDKTAEKGDRNQDKKKGSFFEQLKNSLRKNGRGREKVNSWEGTTSGSLVVQYNNEKDKEKSAGLRITRIDPKTGSVASTSSAKLSGAETKEDILDKYRSKPSSSSASIAPDPSQTSPPYSGGQFNLGMNDDVNIHGEAVMFENAKKKLRFVLSNAEIQQLPCTSNNLHNLKEGWCQQQNVLVAFLHLQQAEAIHLKDRSLLAHLHETTRCVRAFSNEKCLSLLKHLKKEYKKRSPYLSYLMRCRQTLLSITAHLNRLTKRIKCEQEVCKHFFASLCCRLVLQKREQQLLQFATEFHELKLADEKNDLLNNFLLTLQKQIDNDSTWLGVSDEQMNSIKHAIEQSVISRVYMYAMYPNGEVDISRDAVLHEHIQKLSKVLTPNHKYLTIPKKYHYECPWPAAQEELIAMSAHKTPTEKLGCILRCAQTIQNLLCLACSNSSPSADDLVPVFVFVIIKANPPSLMSTIQYIDSFYGSRLHGEQDYYYTQFRGAVEFIKTMEYGS